ncbi:hypothetical protein CASFOL_026821 [Castilleja foliolosa]|uniref:Uncharacterized protein n=1 Tax=Castilleja foliolosa TaxID=1961234 RepID=A0ABD3CK47_9LAMI
MGTEFGYVYDYEFSMVDEEEINSKHKAKKPKTNGAKVLLFDIRTKFIAVLRTDDEEEERVLIDSERYDTSVYEDESDMFLCQHIFERLKDYWMTFPEILTLTRSAFAFAKQMAASPANERLRLIPVVVSLEVFSFYCAERGRIK